MRKYEVRMRKYEVGMRKYEVRMHKYEVGMRMYEVRMRKHEVGMRHHETHNGSKNNSKYQKIPSHTNCESNSDKLKTNNHN